MAISVLLIYLPFGAYYSRARIRLLEKDESSGRKLINILAGLEKNVEDAVVDIMDNPGSASTPAPEHALESEAKAPPERSTLMPVQYQIATSLNRLPIKKHLAYIQNVANSHAVIVCRDINRFEVHRAGEGVVRHLAASFVL